MEDHNTLHLSPEVVLPIHLYLLVILKLHIYLERNFKAGEQFKIPNHLFTGSLRAGNATKVYFELDGKIFGPLSKGNSVVKNFRLHPLDIGKELISIAEGSDLFKSYKAQQATGLSTAKRNNE